jgi:uncharacterized membrane protein YdjX (TVP38/TMEM64 family)
MFESIGDWVEGSGHLAYLLAPLFTTVVAILPFPAELPAAINGMVFGPTWGSLVTWVCALTGAQVSFELARWGGRPLGRRIVPGRWLRRADEVIAHAGWPLMLGLRLLPTVAFTAVNWGAGLTSIRRWTFFWTTAIGIVPGAIAFSSGGAGILAWTRGDAMGPRLIVLAVALLLVSAVLAFLWLGGDHGRDQGRE